MTTSAPTESRKGRLLRGVLFALAVISAALYFGVARLDVHGSSMAPLLCGVDGASDRLLTLRPYYRFIAPARFDLVVFERPESAPESATPSDLSGDLFVKRVMALAGEDVLIQDGDVLIRESGTAASFAVLRKPYGVVRDQLTSCDRYVPGDNDSRWSIPAEGVIEGGELVLSARAGGVAQNLYLQENITLSDPVNGDLRARDVGVRVCLRPLEDPASGEFLLRIELREVGDVFSLELSREKARIVSRRDTSRDPELERELPVRLDPDRPTEVLFMNVDDRILLVIDGEPVLEQDYPGNSGVEGPWRNAPVLTLVQGRVAISELRVEMDVHYTEMGELGVAKPYTVPAAGLYVLGDNSAKSRDSRHFGSVPESMLRGRPIHILAPASRRRGL